MSEDDVTQPPAPPVPRGQKRRWLRRTLTALLVLALIGVATLWYGYRESQRPPRLVTLDILAQRLHAPLKVLQVTDTHDAGPATRRAIAETIRETQPDLIAMTGDITNANSTDLEPARQMARTLVGSGVDVYYVQGNHDYFGGHFPALRQMLLDEGVHIVHDSTEHVDGRWGRLDLVGTDDYYDGLGQLDMALAPTRDKVFRLVLTHDPGIVRDMGLLRGDLDDLTICGHTHGGQIRLPGIGALYAPGQGLLPTYDKGLFEVGEQRARLWVDSGVGQTLPLRLGAPPQVTLITLRPTTQS